MSLNAAYLDAFFTCAQLGHFTKAAERLHITQSALSQRIKNLEEDLGTTLFIRERSGIRITEAGETLLRYCQSKELMENELLEQIRGSNQDALSGVVRIGAFSSVGRSVILPALAEILQTHERVQLKLLTKELYELPPLLKSGAIDFMILDQELTQESLTTQTLGYEKNVLIQKRGYKGSDFYLDHDEDDLTTARYLRKKSAAKLNRHYLDDIYGIIDGVLLGAGRAVAPLHLVSHIRKIETLNPERFLSVPVVLHYYDQPFYSKLHHAVTTALTKNCPDLLNGV